MEAFFRGEDGEGGRDGADVKPTYKNLKSGGDGCPKLCFGVKASRNGESRGWVSNFSDNILISGPIFSQQLGKFVVIQNLGQTIWLLTVT